MPGSSGQLPTVYAAADSARAGLTPLQYDPNQNRVVAGTPIPTPCTVADLVAGDFNGDAKVDLAIRDKASGQVVLRLGPAFTTEVRPNSPAGNLSSRMVVADFFGDGKQEVV